MERLSRLLDQANEEIKKREEIAQSMEELIEKRADCIRLLTEKGERVNSNNISWWEKLATKILFSPFSRYRGMTVNEIFDSRRVNVMIGSMEAPVKVRISSDGTPEKGRIIIAVDGLSEELIIPAKNIPHKRITYLVLDERGDKRATTVFKELDFSELKEYNQLLQQLQSSTTTET